jgi:hypothetical protein
MWDGATALTTDDTEVRVDQDDVSSQYIVLSVQTSTNAAHLPLSLGSAIVSGIELKGGRFGSTTLFWGKWWRKDDGFHKIVAPFVSI